MRIFTAAFEGEVIPDNNLVNHDELHEETQSEIMAEMPEDADEHFINAVAVEAEALISELDNIKEGESTLQATTDIEESIEKTIESDQGMDVVSSEIVAAALEHFYQRNGFTSSFINKASLESFIDNKNNLEATRFALEELKIFNSKLSNGLNIAQEGLLARAVNTFKLIFTSEKKINEKLQQAISDAETKGTKTGIIKTPGWGRSFSVINKTHLTQSDVISYLDRFCKLTKSTELYKLLDDYISILNEIKSEVSKSGIIAKDECVEKINKLNDKVSSFTKKSYDLMAKHEVKNAKNDPSFNCLDADGVKKVGKLANDILNNKDLDRKAEDILNSCYSAENSILSDAQIRLRGYNASDIKAAYALINRMMPAIDELFTIMYSSNRICFSCVNYIKASTN